ncbi:MAG: ASPIC/UnbV domain-containing protein, partial [Zavarzinella sp.]|nr:ASPIC/UnbV domain-containing protein [Zavarzinella sp.]
RADRVTVTWPSGKQQVFTNPAAGRSWRLREGAAAPEALPWSPRREER